MLMMSHGHTVKEDSDPIVSLVELSMDQFSKCTRPGAFLVDIIPALRFLPSWFPGMGFQTIAASWKRTLDDMVDIPHNFVKDQMVRHPLDPLGLW